MTDLLNIAKDILALAKKQGATAADAIVGREPRPSISIRNGEVENLEQAESREATIRVFVGKSSATMSGSVLTPDALERLVARAVEMASWRHPIPMRVLRSIAACHPLP